MAVGIKPASAIRLVVAERLLAIAHHHRNTPVLYQFQGLGRLPAIGDQVTAAYHLRSGQPKLPGTRPQGTGRGEIAVGTAENQQPGIVDYQVCHLSIASRGKVTLTLTRN